MTTGRTLLAIGVLHTVFACIRFADPLSGILADGLVNAAGDAIRGQAFWFFVFGPAMMILGYVIAEQERMSGGPARFLGWSLFGLATLGVLVKPMSGFWLIFVPALLAIRAQRASASA